MLATVAAPKFIPSSALGLACTTAASERIIMGMIGCGIHGEGWNLDRMFENPDQQVVAVCDVDSQHAEQARVKVNAHYSKKFGHDYKCDVYGDFRDLINHKDIDAVDVVTPDLAPETESGHHGRITVAIPQKKREGRPSGNDFGQWLVRIRSRGTCCGTCSRNFLSFPRIL